MVLVWLTAAAGLVAVGAGLLLPADPVREEQGAASSTAERMAAIPSLLRDR